MWWQFVVGIVIGLIAGGGIYSWGWNVGVKYGREEGAYERYVEAMKNE